MLYDWEHDEFTDDLTLYQALASRSKGPVLELACGSGRVLGGLIESGERVVGIDQSEAMLGRARARLKPAGEHARLILGDMERELPPGRFGLAVLALSALGYVPTSERQVRLLSQVARLLGPDGVVAIDLPSVASLVEEPGGVAILQRVGRVGALDAEAAKWMVQRVDWAEQTLQLTSFFDLTWPGRSMSRVTQSVSLRWFARAELELLIDRSGLEIEQMFGSYDGAPFVGASQRMIVIARRGANAQG